MKLIQPYCSLMGATALSALIGACQSSRSEPAQSVSASLPTFWSEEPWMAGSRATDIEKTAPEVLQNGEIYSFQICVHQNKGALEAAELERSSYSSLLNWWKIASPSGQQCKQRIHDYLNAPLPPNAGTEVSRVELGSGYTAEYRTSRPVITSRRVLTAYIAGWRQKDTEHIQASPRQTSCELRSRFDGQVIYEGRLYDVSVNMSGAEFMCGVDNTGNLTYIEH